MWGLDSLCMHACIAGWAGGGAAAVAWAAAGGGRQQQQRPGARTGAPAGAAAEAAPAGGPVLPAAPALAGRCFLQQQRRRQRPAQAHRQPLGPGSGREQAPRRVRGQQRQQQAPALGAVGRDAAAYGPGVVVAGWKASTVGQVRWPYSLWLHARGTGAVRTQSRSCNPAGSMAHADLIYR